MPFSFPSNPSIGQTSTQNGRSYRYAGNNVWELAVVGSTDSRWDLFLPPPPTGLTATGGNAQAALSWTAPSVSAQTPITDYIVQLSSNGGSTWTTFSDGTSTATSATVTGLTNGTAYVFRVAAVNGVGTGAYTTASASVTPVAGDPLFSSVSMLLHFDGASPVDSSSNALTLTLRENAVLSTTQSRFGGKSLFLPASEGSSNALSAPSSSVFEFGSGDFCVEGWYYPTQHRDFSVLWHQGSAFANSPVLYAESNGKLALWGAGTQIIPSANTGSALALNEWSFVAVSRSGGTVRLYVNGSLRGSASYGTSLGTAAFTVGLHPFGGWNNSLACYADELRVTKGSDRGYTGATIDVPTGPFPDA